MTNQASQVYLMARALLQPAWETSERLLKLQTMHPDCISSICITVATDPEIKVLQRAHNDRHTTLTSTGLRTGINDIASVLLRPYTCNSGGVCDWLVCVLQLCSLHFDPSDIF